MKPQRNHSIHSRSKSSIRALRLLFRLVHTTTRPSTASPLSNASNRILSYVDAKIGNFNGDATVLPWPPANPPLQPITATNFFVQPTVCDLTAPSTPTNLVAGGSEPDHDQSFMDGLDR